MGLNADSTTFTLRNPALDYWTGSAWGALTNLATTHAATTSNTQVTWTDAVTLPATWTDGSSYTVQATATDKNNNTFTGTAITFTYDNTVPTVITNLAATAGTSNIALTWTAPTDNVGLDHYVVKRATSAITTTSAWNAATTLTYTLSGTATSYTDTTGTSGTTYYYNVRAVDAADNMASLSNSPSATVGVDTTAPTVITNLAAAPVAGTSNIALTWTAPTDNVGLDHYVVKRATSAITTTSTWDAATTLTYTLSGTATSYTDTTGTSGTTYYYNGAVDAADNMASLSNSPSATVGVDTTAPTLDSITWTDVDDSDTINADDTLRFNFSEAMDTDTITATNIDARLPTSPSHTYGELTATDLSWNDDEDQLTVTLGSDEAIEGGETVDPTSAVTDVACNPDATTGTGPAIEVPEEEEGFAWEWWYTLLIALGALIIIAAIVLLVVLPKRGAAEEYAEEELYEEEEEF
ncbi:hypothetical protein ES707_05979 [subsurface metagenome]